jgi:hypothetical protein
MKTSDLSDLCMNALEYTIRNQVNPRGGVYGLYSNTSLVLAIPPLPERVEIGVHTFYVYQCKRMVSDKLSIADLLLRGRLIGPEVALLQFDRLSSAKHEVAQQALFKMYFNVTTPGNYALDAEVFFLGEAKWDFRPITDFLLTTYDGYMYLGKEGRLTRFVDNSTDSSHLYGSKQRFTVTSSNPERQSYLPFCESIGKLFIIQKVCNLVDGNTLRTQKRLAISQKVTATATCPN